MLKINLTNKLILIISLFVNIHTQELSGNLDASALVSETAVGIDYSEDGSVLVSHLFGPLKFSDYGESLDQGSLEKPVSQEESYNQENYYRPRKGNLWASGIKPMIIARKHKNPLIKNKRLGGRKRIKMHPKIKESDLGPMHDCRDFRECQHVLREFISTIMKMDLHGRKKK